jgi:hypothetical protein
VDGSVLCFFLDIDRCSVSSNIIIAGIILIGTVKFT